jgi:hypothetical protein
MLCFSKEALEATLRKKRECNAKALQIVECLLENTVSEDWFLDCVSSVPYTMWHLYLIENILIKLCVDVPTYCHPHTFLPEP